MYTFYIRIIGWGGVGWGVGWVLLVWGRMGVGLIQTKFSRVDDFILRLSLSRVADLTLKFSLNAINVTTRTEALRTIISAIPASFGQN